MNDLDINLKIVAHLYDYDDEQATRCVEIPIADMDTSIGEVIFSTIGTDRSICFPEYYDVYSESYSDDSLPYILRDGHYEWHVPLDHVTVKEFIETHDIADGIIYTETPPIKGGGIFFDFYASEIVLWIPYLLTVLSAGYTVVNTLEIMRPVYNHLIGKDQKVASVDEFREMLMSKTEWTLDELQSRTRLDTDLILNVLRKEGFMQQENKYKKPWKRTSYYPKLELVWKTPDRRRRYKEIWENLYGINICITSLMFQSDYHKTEHYQVVITMLEYLINEWPGVLKHGKWLNFVELARMPKIESEKEEIQLEYGTRMLAELASHLCMQLDGIED